MGICEQKVICAEMGSQEYQVQWQTFHAETSFEAGKEVVATSLVLIGIFIMALLIRNINYPISKMLNVIGAVLMGVAILIFVWNYTYLGWTIRTGLIFQ